MKKILGLILFFSIFIPFNLMAQTTTTIRSMTEDSSPTGDDIIYVVNNPGGVPQDRKVQLQNLSKAFASANGISLITAADYAAMKILLNLTIGTNVQAYDADLTTYAGITPSANVQSLLSAADYAAIKALLSIDDLITLSGFADGATHLGEFTGGIITDNSTLQVALQELETSIETKEPSLGTPAENDYLLKSSAVGVRAWTNSLTGMVYGGFTANKVAVLDADGDLQADGGSSPLTVSGGNIIFAGTECSTIKDPDADSDHIIWRARAAITITAVHCLATGGTSLTGSLQECDANGANCAGVDGATTMACAAATNVNDDGTLSNPSIDAGDYLKWLTASVDGVQTELVVCFDYTQP